jgi:hypothetical protein
MAQSWEDDLAAGEGGLTEINGGLEGDPGKWARGYTEQKSAEQDTGGSEYASYRPRQDRAPVEAAVAAPRVIALLALAILVLGILYFIIT